MINPGTNTLILLITIYAPIDLSLIDMEPNKRHQWPMMISIAEVIFKIILTWLENSWQ